ncbi:MAG: N-acetylmuramoyl-L-alanine amidase [Myxococcales bacterium]|jgi:N-acetylmuramoyl-L-alanine amidase
MLRTLVLLAAVAALAFPTDLAAAAKPSSADAAFFAAKDAYLSLKEDPKRRKYRDQWMKVAQRFESVAEKYPSSPRAADALYNVAKLYSDLYRVSLARRDLAASIEAWARLYTAYPKSSLADDAHLERARIFRDRKGNIATARAELEAAIACNGDMKAEARRELKALGPVTREERAQAVEMPGRSKPKIAKAPPAKPKARRAKAKEDESARRARLFESMAMVASGDAEEAEDEGAEVEIEEEEAPADGPLDRARLAKLEKVTHASVPLSVQVGLKVKRVIIDAGHGGHDTGAIGPKGTREKDIVLAIALKLRDKLQAEGFEALLTRETDKFVALEDRARFANRNKGDLFVSIHCNANKNRKLRGTETYTLNVSSDRYAIRLAARENASSERSLSDLQFILADLATKANTEESTRLAKAINARVVAAMGDGKKKGRDLGVKQALFYVLLGVRMPSVLVETAFLSNPQEEQELKDPARQQAIADGIASGIVRFVAERDALASAIVD